MSYGDYVEQLAYLLFLTMADERSRPLYHQPSPIPVAYTCPGLLAKDGGALFDHDRHSLGSLRDQKGTFGEIVKRPQIPAKRGKRRRRESAACVSGT